MTHAVRQSLLNDSVTLHSGDCLEVLETLPAASVDAVVTDPPYHFASIVQRFGKPRSAAPKSNGATGVFKRAAKGFMGKAWDGGDVAFRPKTWAAVLRVLKPGGHLVAFGAPKLVHRLAGAIELAGFEMRDRFLELVAADAAMVSFLASLTEAQRDAFFRCIDESDFGGELAWIFGSGFNKQGYIKDAAGGRMEDWGGALKPAYEPIVLARKPLDGTVAETIGRHGVGALRIDGCRVETDAPRPAREKLGGAASAVYGAGLKHSRVAPDTMLGRWPANVLHDGSHEVVAAFPDAPGQRFAVRSDHAAKSGTATYGDYGPRPHADPRTDSGSAARFFYSAKADGVDRLGSNHPTIKPVDLMQWLCRLVCPKGGTVLDPFAGTGTTGEAAWREGMRSVLIEREAEYQSDIVRRMGLALASPKERKRVHDARRGKVAPSEDLPLFGG